MKKADIHLLFTGGYDSTFRLLQGAILENLVIQPHYIIDHRRRSKHLELKAIKNVFAQIGKQFPEARKNILDIIITQLTDIPKSGNDEKIFELRKQIHVGDQFFWLVDYIHLYPTQTFELAIQKDDVSGNGVTSLCIKNSIGQGSGCCLVQNPKPQSLVVFRNFRFPILYITKQEMLKKALENNFADILLNAWTCHRPTIFNNACGHCNPCKLSIKTGFTQLFNKSALKRYKRSLAKA